MKKAYIFALVFALMLSPVFAQQLSISVLKYSPYPAEPGKYVDVWLKLENKGFEEAKNASVEIEKSFPFQKIIGYDYYWSVGSLDTYESSIKKFRFFVNRDAPLGTNYIKVKYTSDPSKDSWIEVYLPVEIKGTTSLLSIENISFEKEIYPGSVSKIKITVKNYGNIYAKNIKISLNGIDKENVKIVPVGKNKEIVSNLSPKKSFSITFEVAVDPDTPAGIYSLPVEITYEDENGNKFETEENIGIIVDKEPELDISIKAEDGFVTKGRANSIRIYIINEGSVDAKFVKIKLKNVQGLKYLGEKEKYIGEVAADDKESVDVKIFVENNVKEILQIPIELDYKDSLGREYTKIIYGSVNVYSEEDLEKFGLTSNRNKIILYLIVAGILIYTFKKLGLFGLISRKLRGE